MGSGVSPVFFCLSEARDKHVHPQWALARSMDIIFLSQRSILHPVRLVWCTAAGLLVVLLSVRRGAAFGGVRFWLCCVCED